jgi:hypothetical protein
LERLIERRASEVGISESEAYKNSRFSEKIDLLKENLPDFMVRNKKIYGILSAGIHSLTEEECAEYYEILETSVHIIVEEDAEKQKKLQRTSAAQKVIDALRGKKET